MLPANSRENARPAAGTKSRWRSRPFQVNDIPERIEFIGQSYQTLVHAAAPLAQRDLVKIKGFDRFDFVFKRTAFQEMI
jgi:hypothetical protein